MTETFVNGQLMGVFLFGLGLFIGWLVWGGK
jgi:hypothetical protein